MKLAGAIGLYLLLSAAAIAARELQALENGGFYSGVLSYGHRLQEDEPLCSTDGAVCLIVQADGNLVLYNFEAFSQYGPVNAAAIYSTRTYGASPAPFVLIMQEDCNLVLYNSNGQEPADFVFATGTSGSGPCHVAVSSAGGGGFAVIDESSGSALFTAGAYSPAGTPAGTLASAHDLAQDVKLFSSDAATFVVVQPDGNTVLYYTDLYSVHGNTSAAAVWGSGSSGAKPPPFVLTMQTDCNLVEYNGNGRLPADAVFGSGTWNVGAVPPCAASVSNSGFLSVTDANGKLLYSRPSPSVRTATTLLSLVAPAFPVASELATLSAGLYSGSGATPVVGATLLVDPGDGSGLCPATTNATGQASVEHVYSALNIFNATFTFDGDLMHAPSAHALPVEVGPQPTQISLAVSPPDLAPNVPTSFTATLRAVKPGSPPLANQNVTISTGTGIYHGVTDARGVFQLSGIVNGSYIYQSQLYAEYLGTCAGSCDAPSAGGYGPSAFFIYNANSPVTADLAISPLPPVPGAATTLTATIRAATPPYAPIPGAMATIYPNVGEGQVTMEGGYAYNGATDANGQFNVVAHYIKDGQYFPSVGTSVNQPAGGPIYGLVSMFAEVNTRLNTTYNVRPFNQFFGG